MKYFAAVLLLAACACADVSHIVGQSKDGNTPIVKQAIDVGTDGAYQWNYEAGNGIIAQEEGSLKAGGADGEVQVAQGSASWTAPDGTPIKLTYIADENGFQPQGDHLPTPHPIPDYILRSIEYNKAHPEEEEPQKP